MLMIEATANSIAGGLLVDDIWSLILELCTGTIFRSRTFTTGEERPNVVDPICDLRAVCRNFNQICLESLTSIEIPHQSCLPHPEECFPRSLIAHVLLARPKRIKEILILDYEMSINGFIFSIEHSNAIQEISNSLWTSIARCQELEVARLELVLSPWPYNEIEEDSDIEKIAVSGALVCAVGERCTKLKHLELECDHIDGAFDSPTSFRALEYLNIRVSAIEDLVMSGNFAHFTSLKEVRSMMGIESMHSAISCAPSLQIIKFSGEAGYENTSEVTDASLFKFCNQHCKGKPICSTLNTLVFNGDDIKDVGLIVLLTTFPRLERLAFRGCSLQLGEEALQKLSNMKHLTDLYISENDGNWLGPTKTWLAFAVKYFPRSLVKLEISDWQWDAMDAEDRASEESKKAYKEYIKECFRAQLPSLEEKGVVFDDDLWSWSHGPLSGWR